MRGAALQRWAESEFPGESRDELVGATARREQLGRRPRAARARRVPPREGLCAGRDAYDPWICAVSTMLDSYVDQASDAADGEHSYVGYYPSREVAGLACVELIERRRARPGVCTTASAMR